MSFLIELDLQINLKFFCIFAVDKLQINFLVYDYLKAIKDSWVTPVLCGDVLFLIKRIEICSQLQYLIVKFLNYSVPYDFLINLFSKGVTSMSKSLFRDNSLGWRQVSCKVSCIYISQNSVFYFICK